MKKLLVILFLLLSSFVYSQIDYNIYEGLTKSELRKSFRYDDYKFSFEQKLYVDIDSTGAWFSSDKYYTWLVYYNEDNRALFVFDNETNRIVKYYILLNNLENYWDYFEYYDHLFKRTVGLKWIDDAGGYTVEINLIPKQTSCAIYVERKN